jgi:hypothetical protein
MTAVRVFYFVGLVVFAYGGVRALDYLDTHQTSPLVSGLVIAALGAGLLALAVARHRRLRPGDRRPIYGNAKQAGRIGLVVAAGLAVFGGLAVWAVFSPGVGPKALPIAALFIAMAAWSLIDARRKLRAAAHPDGQAAGGGVGG